MLSLDEQQTSSLLQNLYTFIPASIAGVLLAMSPSIFRRLIAFWSGAGDNVPTKALTEEEQARDKENFQKAVEEAVSAAVKNDAFTKAVADHLAEQLKPFESNLNTIPSITDDISSKIADLESKLLAFTKELSDRLSDSNTNATTHMGQLSGSVKASHDATSNKLTALEEAIAQVTASLAGLGSDVKEVQMQVASPDTTHLSAHTEKLDGIATNLKTLHEEGPAPVASALSDHSAKLEAVSAELKSIQEHLAAQDNTFLSAHSTKLDNLSAALANAGARTETKDELSNIVADLSSIKTSIESGNTTTVNEISSLSIQVGTVLSAVQRQTSTDMSSEILAGIKTSNDANATHASALADLKAATEANLPVLTGLEEKVGKVIDSVSEIKGADSSADILEALKSSNGSHAAHATTLAKIKEASSASAPTDLSSLKTIESDVKEITTTLQTHSTTLSEIKTATSGTEILSTLTAQSTTLAEIKDSISSSDILSHIQSIKSDVSDSKAKLNDINTVEVLEEVKSVKAIVDKPSSDAEILTEVKGVKSVIEAGVRIASDAKIVTDIKDVKTLVENGVSLSDKSMAKLKDVVGVEVKGVEVEHVKEMQDIGGAKEKGEYGENGIKAEEVEAAV